MEQSGLRKIVASNFRIKSSNRPKILILPKIYKDNTNVYYTYPIILDERKNYNRAKILYYLEKLGVPSMGEGYLNLHLLPIVIWLV